MPAGTSYNYISTTEFGAYNPEVDTSLYSDATLSGMITRASKQIDNYVGYTFLRETITAEKTKGYVDSDNSLVIYTRKRPINSVTSVSIVKGSYSGSITLSSGGTDRYDIPSTADCIVIPGDDITISTVSIIDWSALRATEFWVEVTYNAGYYGYEIPEPIKDACQLWVMDLIARKQNLTGATSIRQGGISMTYSARSGESDLIKDAKQILNEYRRVALL